METLETPRSKSLLTVGLLVSLLALSGCACLPGSEKFIGLFDSDATEAHAADPTAASASVTDITPEQANDLLGLTRESVQLQKQTLKEVQEINARTKSKAKSSKK